MQKDIPNQSSNKKESAAPVTKNIFPAGNTRRMVSGPGNAETDSKRSGEKGDHDIVLLTKNHESYRLIGQPFFLMERKIRRILSQSKIPVLASKRDTMDILAHFRDQFNL